MKSRFILGVMLFLALPLSAQSQLSVGALPRIHFTFDHPDLVVVHYEIDIDANGQAHYASRIKGQEKGTIEEGIERDFTLSAATRDRLFALIKVANNLVGNFDYTKHRLAFSGTKRLSYTDANGTNTAKYGWSENEALMRLTELLQGISGTLEEEPTLQRLRRFDKLGLDAELGKMEQLVRSGWMRELNLIAPTLKEIAADTTIMGVARKRAERLYQLASSQASNQT
jgi:hypothetical protein